MLLWGCIKICHWTVILLYIGHSASVPLPWGCRMVLFHSRTSDIPLKEIKVGIHVKLTSFQAETQEMTHKWPSLFSDVRETNQHTAVPSMEARLFCPNEFSSAPYPEGGSSEQCMLIQYYARKLRLLLTPFANHAVDQRGLRMMYLLWMHLYATLFFRNNNNKLIEWMTRIVDFNILISVSLTVGQVLDGLVSLLSSEFLHSNELRVFSEVT